MLYRKIEKELKDYFISDSNKILLIEGARQVGKTYIIRKAAKEIFENFVEINFLSDSKGERLFAAVGNKDDFYLQLGMLFGEKLDKKENTLVFLDEIQAYPDFLTLLKFLKEDDKFTYIASGSLLGLALSNTPSIPIGSIEIKKMFPLDFEEFLLANGVGEYAISEVKKRFEKKETLPESTHNFMMDMFRKYLLVGGMPDAVNSYIETKNIVKIRDIHKDIHNLYSIDAAQYDEQNRLKIKKIYDMVPSNMGNKKKRVMLNRIEGKKGKSFRDYEDEFEYLISSGISLGVNAISNPKFPLKESEVKNLVKLYMSDVGLLTNELYKRNIRPVLDDIASINLGSLYESAVAQELKAHGFDLYYYDNKAKGEVDFLIDDYNLLSIVPLKIKSGKDYTVHSALNTFMKNEEYNAKRGYVFSNNREIKEKNNIIYMPVYNIMFLEPDRLDDIYF